MQTISLRCVHTPLRVVRHLRASCRVRLDAPEILGCRPLATEVEQELAALRGVTTATAVADTGKSARRLRSSIGIPFVAPRDRATSRGDAEASISWLPSLRLGKDDSSISAAVDDTPWHALDADEVLSLVQSGRVGLSETQAAARQHRKSLDDNPVRSRISILLSQVSNLPTGLLLGSSTLSALVGDWIDWAAVLSTVAVDATIGYQIEHTNEELLASWRRLESGEATVVRQDDLSTVAVSDLVRGDVIVCAAGDLVPADARVIEAHHLRCDEGLLTGESRAQTKGTESVPKDAPIAERTSMLYAGTTVVGGHGRAVVTAIGRETEAGRIGQLLAHEETPLERRLREFSNNATLAALVAGVASAATRFLRGQSLHQVVRGGVALSVAAIPESLPIVSTAALVRTMQRMRKHGMVVRRLVTAETLGGVAVVCADKTGTLTRNEMKLKLIDLGAGAITPDDIRADPDHIFTDGPTLALAAAVLNSDVDVQEGKIVGSSTERALIEAVETAGLHRIDLRERFPRLSLRERDSGHSYVLTVHAASNGDRVAFVKGAPEQVLELCDFDLNGSLDKSDRVARLRRNNELADQGLRVLSLAWKKIPDEKSVEAEEGYTWIGMVALDDPLRDGAADAVRNAARAGVRTMILTGDQRRTAEAIARQVGLTGEALDGSEVKQLLTQGGTAATDRVCRAGVLSRVTPTDKLAVIHALRERGEIVAMAGDGINDALALRAADIGIAIGVHSSDVARQAADVVLENEDLRSILYAIGEGRIVQDNLRRAINYLLAHNLSEVILVLGAAVIGASEPLRPLQLLWLNLFSEALPALGLAFEPGEPHILDRGLGPPDAPLLDGDARWRIARDGFRLAALATAALAVGGPATAFATLGAAQIGYAAICRAEGVPPAREFISFVGGAAGLHAATLIFAPLRAVLGLPGTASFTEVAGFASGLMIPTLLWNRSQRGDVIVGHPLTAAPSPATKANKSFAAS
jgi:P-type Ca2+ transporter type 2C